MRGHPGTPGQVAAHAGDVAGLDGSVVGHHGARPVAHLSGRGVGVGTGGQVIPAHSQTVTSPPRPGFKLTIQVSGVLCGVWCGVSLKFKVLPSILICLVNLFQTNVQTRTLLLLLV